MLYFSEKILGKLMKNIVLVGLMGCGKTTVGKAITEKINGFEFIDIDIEIEIFFNDNNEYIKYNGKTYIVYSGSLGYINEYNSSNTDKKDDGGGTGWLPWI